MRDFVMGAGKDYSVLIVSYELFRKHTDALSQLNNLLLICDEGMWDHRTVHRGLVRQLCGVMRTHCLCL